MSNISREELASISVSLQEAYDRGKKDINFFSALALPSVFRYPFPPFYIVAWQLITSTEDNRKEELFRFLLGLPRGHAKTTFIKVVIAWMLCYDYASFILVVCSNSQLAENIVADVHDIMASPNITAIYGEWVGSLAIDSKDTKKGSYHSHSITLVGSGWSSGIRGLNLQNQRPDFIFCDDVQTRENAYSPSESEKLLNELVGTIFHALSPTGRRTIVYVGNLYTEDCILQKFRENPHWTSMVTGAILETREPLWPELISLKELQESYEHDYALGKSDIWFAEIMNDPRSSLHTLLHSQLPDSDVPIIEADDGAFITIDPAGFRSTSDDNVIVLHKKYNNKGYVVKISHGIKNPAEIVKESLVIALNNGVSLIGIESVAYQQSLKFWIDHFMRELGITHITTVELHPHGRSKESRIRQFVEELYKESYYILDEEAKRLITWQGSLYKFGKKNNKDDILDAAAYGIDIRNEFWSLIRPLQGYESNIIDPNKCSVIDTSCF